jgi:hypothetical protein
MPSGFEPLEYRMTSPVSLFCALLPVGSRDVLSRVQEMHPTFVALDLAGFLHRAMDLTVDLARFIVG